VKLHPYLMFDGSCEEAFRFYEKALDGAVMMMMTYAESPMASMVPPDFGEKIIHASMIVEGQPLSGADAMPGHFRKPQGFSVTLDIEDPAEAERVFAALSQGGTIGLPIQPTFWAERFGMCVDRFGTPWMINCGKPGGA